MTGPPPISATGRPGQFPTPEPPTDWKAEAERLRRELWAERASGDASRTEARWHAERANRAREALEKGRRFERAYQDSLGATPTRAQYEILDNLQSAFLDAYLEILEPERG